jgi:Tfp pilus assembly protein PilX
MTYSRACDALLHGPRRSSPGAAQGAQRGAVLITSLLMLLALTLLAVASIRLSSANLLIVDNMQSQQRAEAAARRAVADVLSGQTAFRSPAGEITQTIDGVDVTVSARECIHAVPAKGGSLRWEYGPIRQADTTWEFSATANDAGSGAKTIVHQGVMIRVTAGQCPQ